MRRLRPVAAALFAGGIAVLLVACGTTREAPSATASPTPPPAHVRLYVIGDSWAAGAYADPGATYLQVAAAALGWSVHVDAADGTGYQTASSYGATYAKRAASIPASARADVVLIQGGSNDIGRPAAKFPAAVEATVALVERRFPHAHVVLLGAGPDPWPVDANQRRIDADLRAAAKAEHVSFVSILSEAWVTSANRDDVISPVHGHPTVVGHAYLGGRLAADLKALSAAWAK